MERQETVQECNMIIKDLEKSTFIDFPGKVACTIFIKGCNFRCSFCHNPELMSLKGNGLSEEKVLDFLKKRRKYLEGVCFTGGEPLLTLDFNFLEKIKRMDYKIKIDTNGSHPKKLKALIDKKLVDYIAMDIKSSKEKYEKLANCTVDFKSIEESMKLISNFPNYEFRTTIIPGTHNRNEIRKIKQWLTKSTQKQKLTNYSLQSFCSRPEGMNDDKFKKTPSPSPNLLKNLKEELKEIFNNVEIKD